MSGRGEVLVDKVNTIIGGIYISSHTASPYTPVSLLCST